MADEGPIGDCPEGRKVSTLSGTLKTMSRCGLVRPEVLVREIQMDLSIVA